MCAARVLFSHILNYSFVLSISHLFYGSFQLYYGWMWNVLPRLLYLISPPALLMLSREMEGPRMKWVTGNGPRYWTAQPCFLSSLGLQQRWKQAAVTQSRYHRAHRPSFPLPSEHKSKQTLPPLACFLSGIWAHQWEKQQKWTSSGEHVFQFTTKITPHFAFSIVDSLCFQWDVQSSEKPLLSRPPFCPITRTPSWSVSLSALFFVAHGQHCIVFPIADCDMRPMQCIITRITFVMEIRRTAQKMSENITRRVIVCEVMLQLHTQRVSRGGGYNNMGFLGYSQIKMLNTGVYTIIFVFPSKASLGSRALFLIGNGKW